MSKNTIAQSRQLLKNYFEPNARPRSEEFEAFIDSVLVHNEDKIAKPAGSPVSIESEGDVAGPQKLLDFYTHFKDPAPQWSVSQNPRGKDGPEPGWNISESVNEQDKSRFFIRKNAGDIGIGTIDPEARLHVALQPKETMHPLAIDKAGNRLLMLDNHGRLGIGTKAPVEALQIGDRWTFHNGGHKVIGYNFRSKGEDKRIVKGAAAAMRFTSTGDIIFQAAETGAAGAAIPWNSPLQVYSNGNLRIGNFGHEDKDEWPRITWHRDIARKWDEGLIKSASSRGVFKKAGFGIHMHESRQFGLWSTGWNPLFAVSGSTGDVYAKGNVGIGATNPQDKLDIHGALRFNGNADTRVYGATRAAKNTVVLDGHWDELEVKGRVIDWTGSNLHIGYQNNHLAHCIEMGRNVGSTRFLTGTSEVMRIHNNGNVGIGTANPEEKFHVIGTASIHGNIGSPKDAHWKTKMHTLELTNSDKGDVVLSFHRSGSSNAAIKHSTLGGLSFSANGAYNTHHLFIKSDGKVGIGTTAPDMKLTVKGNLNVGGTANGQIRVRHVNGKSHTSTNYDSLYLNYGTGKSVYVGHGGKKANLLVDGTIKADAFVLNNGKPLTAGSTSLWAKNSKGIHYGSNVGIGTSAPAYKLQTQGDIYANGGWMRVSGKAGLYFQSYGGGFYMADSTWIRTYNNKSFYHNAGIMRTDGTLQVGPNGNRFIVNAAGNVGIGITGPSNTQGWHRVLDVHGNHHAKMLITTKTGGVKTGIFSHYNWGGAVGKIGTESNHDLRLMAGYGKDKLTIKTNGCIGINTTAPAAPLSIAGNGKERTPDANMHITNDCILFGGRNNKKQTDSAQISAGLHAANSLCIVGMASSTSHRTRKVNMWAEAGFQLNGPAFKNVPGGDWVYRSDSRLKKDVSPF